MANGASSANPLGLGLVIVGAAALAIATFLPFVEPVSALRMVEHNSLIQHGGWPLIALALGIAGSGYRASRGKPIEVLVPHVLCTLAAVLLIGDATDTDMRTLYPVQINGTVDTSQSGTVASLGIAIYVAAAGVAAAFIGSLLIPQSARRTPDPSVAAWEDSAATKRCPDCAETILADAKVCKHCGYRFAPAASSEPATKPPASAQPTKQTKAAPAKQSSKPAPSQQTRKPGSLRPQFDPNRPGGLKGFVQDWKAIQNPAKPQGKAQHKDSPPNTLH